MKPQTVREAAYNAWVWAIYDEYPDCDISATLTGCIVRRDGEIVEEIDYEPDPHEAARVRH